ncbi:MAG: hypothetical protein MPN21_19135 [Thermoanaerobaculia bacterium]|nr:hypothetical protein [Thermoanaerobaculia bacterium]
MRFASHEIDFWELRCAETSYAQHPETFWIPSESERNSARRGQAAKLIFEIEVADETGKILIESERMWVVVSEIGDGFYIGILDNQPASIEPSDDVYLRFGAEVPFAARHIIEIADPPADYSAWQLEQPPEVRWHGRDSRSS